MYHMYQRAFIDFFEDELVAFGYEWKNLVAEYLFKGQEPLISCLVAGLGHPLIHLAYAFELSNSTIAIEGLAMTTTMYNGLHKYLDDPSYTQPSAHPTTSLIQILERVRTDDRLSPSQIANSDTTDDIDNLVLDHEAVILEHWNSWTISDARAQFKDSQRTAALLLVGTQPLPTSTREYSFFLVHLLTTSHAVRILLPLIPHEFHVPLLRQWWLLALSTYIS
ncbi:MAG: hypothetical protein M1838_000478, partial [Thelocarpon superellum]